MLWLWWVCDIVLQIDGIGVVGIRTTRECLLDDGLLGGGAMLFTIVGIDCRVCSVVVFNRISYVIRISKGSGHKWRHQIERATRGNARPHEMDEVVSAINHINIRFVTYLGGVFIMTGI